MASTDVPLPVSAASGSPVYRTLAQFPVVCFTLALLTDVVYWRTAHLMWAEFSAWLLLAGIVVGVLAALAGAVEFLASREARYYGVDWPQVVGTVIVLVLAFFNNLIHTRDGWTSVVPWGLTLSALTVLVIVVTGLLRAFSRSRARRSAPV